MSNIYSETIPDRMSKGETTEKVEYPEKLIITIDKVENPTVGEIIKTIRLYILECKRSNVNPDIILNFCIGTMDADSHKYIQNYITLAEYIYNTTNADNSLSYMIFIRGHFLSCFTPLIFLGIPLHCTEYTYVEEYNANSITHNQYSGAIEEFARGIGKKINNPLIVNRQYLVNNGNIVNT